MRQRGPLVAAIAGAVIALLIVVGLILPRSKQVSDAHTKLAAAQQQQGMLQAKLAELKDTATRAGKYRRQLQLLEAGVPPTVDLPGLIRLLNDTADRSAVDFMSIAPGQPQLASAGAVPVSAPAPTPSSTLAPPPAAPVVAAGSLGVSLIPIQITVDGSYFAIDEYLYKLETLPRLSNVLTVGLQVGPGGYPQLELAITANFFTSDTSAGPGSVPGAQGSGTAPPAGTIPAPTSSPTSASSPTPASSGSPSASPSSTPTGTG